jgi:hypothetical protein
MRALPTTDRKEGRRTKNEKLPTNRRTDDFKVAGRIGAAASDANDRAG